MPMAAERDGRGRSHTVRRLALLLRSPWVRAGITLLLLVASLPGAYLIMRGNVGAVPEAVSQ